MKKKIISVAILASIVISAAAWNFNQGKTETKLNDLALANVEALARYEDDYCPNGCLDESGSGCWCKQWYPKVKEATWH